VELITAQVGGTPAAFASVSDIARQRRACEPEEAAPQFLRELITAFEEAEQLAEDDTVAESIRPGTAFREAFESRVNAERVSAQPSVRDVLRQLWDEARLAATRGVAVAQAAAPGEVPPHVLLRRAWGGEFLVRREGADLWLEWFGGASPKVFELHAQGPVELQPEPIDGGTRWGLDRESSISASRWAELGGSRLDLGMPEE